MATKKAVRADVKVRKVVHKTTLLTCDYSTYRAALKMKPGDQMDVEFVNDIVSSSAGEADESTHHRLRRVRLILRQMYGGYRRVNLRSAHGECVRCVIVGAVKGKEDSPSCRVRVERI